MVQPVQVAAHAASSRKETPNGSASRLEQFTHTLVAYDPGIYCIFWNYTKFWLNSPYRQDRIEMLKKQHAEA
jgi:hypothetical protein